MIEREWKIYGVAVLAFLTLTVNILRCIPEPLDNSSEYPEMSYQQIAAENGTLVNLSKQPFSTYQNYFDVVDRLGRLDLAIARYEKTHLNLDPRYPSSVREFAVNINFLRFQNEDRGRSRLMYTAQGKEAEEFDLAMKNRDNRWGDLVLHRKTDPKDELKFWQSMIIFQFGFTPFAWFIFKLRNEEVGGRIAFEVGNPWFIFCLVAWEIGLFKYKAAPLKTQIRLLIKYATLSLSSILSFGAATLKAQTKKPDGSSPDPDNHTLVISGNSHGLSEYLGLNGFPFHNEPVIQSSLTVLHKKSGFYLGYWKSVPAVASHIQPNFAIEEDYTVGKKIMLRKRVVDVSATMFNVTPLKQAVRGDLLQLSVFVRDLIPGPVSNYLWVRTVQPFKDGKPPGGHFVHFGVNRDLRAFGNTKFSLTAEGVWDVKGAFGFQKAGIARWGGAFKIPLGNIFTLDLPLIRMSVPFTKPRDDRKFEWVWGAGLNFSFGM